MAKRKSFVAEDHVRADWDADHLIEMLERRARGYTGLLREVLCTAADRIRDDQVYLARQDDEVRGLEDEVAHHTAVGSDGDPI